MVLRKRNVNILGVHWKIRLLGSRGVTKNQHRWRDCLKRGAWTFCRFKVGLARKRRGILIMIFYCCFYNQLWVKWLCIDIVNSFGHAGQTHSRFPKCMGSLTLKEMHIKLTSLVICLINNNLVNTSSPPEEEKDSIYCI